MKRNRFLNPYENEAWEEVQNKEHNDGYDVVVEELKEDLSASSQKIKRYSDRVDQYNQNRTFVNNLKRFYQYLQGNGPNIAEGAPE